MQSSTDINLLTSPPNNEIAAERTATHSLRPMTAHAVPRVVKVRMLERALSSFVGPPDSIFVDYSDGV